jgi:hypothetical protein
VLLVCALAACTPAAPPTSTPISTLSQDQLVKRLATVELPPTLSPNDFIATRSAARPTSTPIPSATFTQTPYIGVFLGESGSSGGDIPNIDAAQFAGTLVANAPEFPTLSAPACIIPPDPIYGAAWGGNPAVRDGIGCAGEPPTSYIGESQFFERGVMYTLPTGEIYAILPGGAVSGRYWYAPIAPPEQTWEVLPPEGLRVPTGEFGAVWRAVEAVRQSLGFAQTDEQPVSLTLQRFERGALLLDGSAGQTFAFIGVTGGQNGEGTVYGPFTSALGQ